MSAGRGCGLCGADPGPDARVALVDGRLRVVCAEHASESYEGYGLGHVLYAWGLWFLAIWLGGFLPPGLAVLGVAAEVLAVAAAATLAVAWGRRSRR
jgi:hypothetical protein